MKFLDRLEESAALKIVASIVDMAHFFSFSIQLTLYSQQIKTSQ
jgi:hypothetical protein